MMLAVSLVIWGSTVTFGVVAGLLALVAILAGWWLRGRQEAVQRQQLSGLQSAREPTASSATAEVAAATSERRETSGQGETFRAGPPGLNLSVARDEFQRRREWLEARFFTLAARTGKPRGLEWNDCRFADNFMLARQRDTGELRSFVSVTIRFTAVAGGGMEDNPNVHNLREATAVFNWDGESWSTDGRAVFNLNPTQTLERFQLEVIE